MIAHSEDRFERICILGMGTHTVTEKVKVGTGASAGRVITLVALLPHADAEPTPREAFVEKSRLLMQLQERMIAETLELGRARTHYVAREFIDGVSLGKLLRYQRSRGLALPAASACEVALQLAVTQMALYQKMRKLSPRLSRISFGFAATLRSLVVTPVGSVRWVDPLSLDQPTLAQSGIGAAPADDVGALAALL